MPIIVAAMLTKFGDTVAGGCGAAALIDEKTNRDGILISCGLLPPYHSSMLVSNNISTSVNGATTPVDIRCASRLGFCLWANFKPQCNLELDKDCTNARTASSSRWWASRPCWGTEQAPLASEGVHGESLAMSHHVELS